MRALGWAAAAGAAAWMVHAWGAQVALPLVAHRRGPAGDRRVALTFDDGPDPEWTPRLLRLLDRRGVRATFFLVGERAARHPEIVRAIAAGGHEVGNHTWRHRNAWLLSPGRAALEVLGGARILGAILGSVPALLRPPWGIVSAATLRTAGRHRFPIVLWSVQPEGLRPRPVARQLHDLAVRIHDGAIVDLHDAPGLPGAPARCLELLPGLLDLLEARGHWTVPAGALLAPALEKPWGGRDPWGSIRRDHTPR